MNTPSCTDEDAIRFLIASPVTVKATEATVTKKAF